jgi:hypothetical protein
MADSWGTKLNRIAELISQLGALGDEQIADFLETAGVTGCPGEAACCPVANYLKSDVANVEVSVRPDDVTVSDDATSYILRMPPSVWRFIRSFDQGDYPALVTTTPHEVTPRTDMLSWPA